MGASLRTAWSASGATGASDSNVFVHEDVDFSYEEIGEVFMCNVKKQGSVTDVTYRLA